MRRDKRSAPATRRASRGRRQRAETLRRAVRRQDRAPFGMSSRATLSRWLESSWRRPQMWVYDFVAVKLKMMPSNG